VNQLALFSDQAAGPAGLRYVTEFISVETERELIARISELPLKPFQFGVFEGNRRVKSFGFRYDYTLQKLEQSDPIPDWLEAIARSVEHRRRGSGWERFTLDAEPRSLYLLDGEARKNWEHSIPPVDEHRYSITFRTMARQS